jgi:hypothetical protein
MLKFNHVEDYIEVLAGYDPGGNALLFNTGKYTFSLARYDVNIVESMASSTLWNNQALTDRQGELAIKLVLKYKRQFAQHDIDITSIEENPQWRYPLRTIDRSQRIWLDDQKIGLRFPYDRALIDNVQEYKKNCQGSAVWDHEEKAWWFGLTEANINWAVAWGETYNFEIDPLVRDLFDKILECEQTLYEIKLVQVDNGYTITNAATSLIEYIEVNLGGFGSNNIIKLVDYASVLGYTYDDSLVRPALLDVFRAQRNAHVQPSDSNLELIFAYAELTNRYPICIYDPGLKGVDLSRFEEGDIVRFNTSGKTKTCNYNIHDVKVVYANKIPATWDYDIPLLVSTQELMYGGKRMEWLQRAEKVIYYCNTLLREND